MTYNWELSPEGISCLDPEKTCQGDLCRLDLAFATEISRIKREWKARNHVKNGFDKKSTCLPAVKGFRSMDGAKKSENSPKIMVQSQCCGQGLTRSLFKPDRKECCKDGSVRDFGTC